MGVSTNPQRKKYHKLVAEDGASEPYAMSYLLEDQSEAALQESRRQVFLDQVHLCLALSAAASSLSPAVLVKREEFPVARFENLTALKVDVELRPDEPYLMDQVGHAVDTQVLPMGIFSFVFGQKAMTRCAVHSLIDWSENPFISGLYIVYLFRR